MNHEFDALWDMRDGKTFFSGPLYSIAPHQHGAPVFLAGLYGKFELRMQGGDWRTCRTAVIPAGSVHELELHGEPISVFYIEPTVADMRALIPLIRHAAEEGGALLGGGGEVTMMRELYEHRYRSDWTTEPLDDFLAFSIRRLGANGIDPRITQVLRYFHGHCDDLSSVSHFANGLGLSASRFQHLFTEQIGVPFRRYRGWTRLLAAIRHIIKGRSFTEAAHAVGFTDSAHFSRECRKTFGAAPTVGLKNLARFQG